MRWSSTSSTRRPRFCSTNERAWPDFRNVLTTRCCRLQLLSNGPAAINQFGGRGLGTITAEYLRVATTADRKPRIRGKVVGQQRWVPSPPCCRSATRPAGDSWSFRNLETARKSEQALLSGHSGEAPSERLGGGVGGLVVAELSGAAFAGPPGCRPVVSRFGNLEFTRSCAATNCWNLVPPSP